MIYYYYIVYIMYIINTIMYYYVILLIFILFTVFIDYCFNVLINLWIFIYFVNCLWIHEFFVDLCIDGFSVLSG